MVLIRNPYLICFQCEIWAPAFAPWKARVPWRRQLQLPYSVHELGFASDGTGWVGVGRGRWRHEEPEMLPVCRTCFE